MLVPARADDGAPAERWQHGAELEPALAPRMPGRVADHVLALRATFVPAVGGEAPEPLIGNREVEAAERFRRDYIRGVEGVREVPPYNPDKPLRSGSADAHDVQIARAMAVGRHRAIAELLGSRMTAWLIAFLVEDLSYVAMADRYWPTRDGRKQMQGAMVTMLRLLSRLYAALDRQRAKPRAAPVARRPSPPESA